MNELALFTGAGGGILGGHLLGWKTVAACEIEDYPRETLLRRQLDGCLPRFPVWDDICTFNGKPFKGKIDIITGGFPCQDISAAGKGAGITGKRSGLWSEMARIIGEVRPRFAFMENSPVLTSRGLGTVLGDLAEMGYDARWCVLGADDAGAPHRRKRIWILAYTSMYGQPPAKIRNGIDEGSDYSKAREKTTSESKGLCSAGIDEDVANAESRGPRKPPKREGREDISRRGKKITWWDKDPAEIHDTNSLDVGEEQEVFGGGKSSTKPCGSCKTGMREVRPTKPVMGRVANGVANRVDRLKAIGNGQVPAVAALAFLKLSEDIK